MKLDILAFGAHPDDVELSCSATLMKQVSMGHKVGIVDLTQGELGTRGTAEIRLKEANASAKIIGALVRDNLSMADGFFKNDREHQLQVIQKIRQYQPDVVLMNAPYDRHPDHGRASALVAESCFLAGLRMIETKLDGKDQEAFRPRVFYQYIQFHDIHPSFVVDVTDFLEKKIEAIKTFKSQFYDPNSKEPSTLISTPEFLDHVKHRASEMGRIIGVKYGEGFIANRYVGVNNILDLK
jgi:N-acetylglucosamine malate deacetylase 1